MRVLGMRIVHSSISRRSSIQLVTKSLTAAALISLSSVLAIAQESEKTKQTSVANSPVGQNLPLEIGKDDPTKFFDSAELVACCQAINSGDLPALSNAISLKLDVNAPGYGGVTLLHWALARKNFEAFELLLKGGASPDAKLTHKLSGLAGYFIEGDSVLMSSLWFGMSRLKFFDAALPYTKDPNQRRKNGQTLLMIHLRQFVGVQDKCIEAMLKVGVDVNAQDNAGSTALHQGIAHGHYTQCETLLRSGADPSIRDTKGLTAVDFAETEIERIQKNPNAMREPLRSDLTQLTSLVESMKQAKK